MAAIKDWTIEFNTKMDEAGFNSDNISVLDADGNEMDIKISSVHNGEAVNISSERSYKPETYYLYITTHVKSVHKINLKEFIQMEFIVE